MKNILIIIFTAFACVSLYAQEQTIPRSTTLESQGDTLYRIVTVFQFPDGREVIERSALLDSQTIVRNAFRTIFDGENQFYKEPARRLLEHRNITQTYQDANLILNQLTGENYLTLAWSQFSENYKGFYRMDSANVQKYLAVDSLRNFYEIRANGTPRPGGVSGKIQPLTQNLFATTIFGNQISTTSRRWFKLREDSRLYVSLDSVYTFLYLGPTLEEAQEFIESLQGG